MGDKRFPAVPVSVRPGKEKSSLSSLGFGNHVGSNKVFWEL